MYISFVVLWLIIAVSVLLGVGIAYLSPTAIPVERGISSIVLAVLVPVLLWFFKWLDKKYPVKSKRRLKNGNKS